MRPLLYKIILFPAVLVLLALLYAIVRIFVADQFVIPTWSMTPTLVPDGRVVVNKLIMHSPARRRA